MDIIKSRIQAHLQCVQQMHADDALMERVHQVIDDTVELFRNAGKLLLCGNGGSAADAQHLAAEFSGRFYKDRKPLFAEALHVNTSYLTAVANDYDYEQVYARMVQAAGEPGDMLWSFSTSGNSPNVLRATEVAQTVGMQTVAFTGAAGGKLFGIAQQTLNVPSADTPRIQEMHMLLGHIICEQVEARLFP